MEQHKKLTSHDFDLLIPSASISVDELLTDVDSYRRLVGCLIYLTITRPDICYIVQYLSQFMHSPKQSHWHAALRVVRYIKGSPGLGLLLPSCSDLDLFAYCDADWTTCPMTRRPLTGYCIKLGRSLISWYCKKQNTVSRSFAEAEYRAMATITCEIVWLVGLLQDMGV